MQPYYYMVYAIRRMLGSSGDARDFGELRVVAFFLLLQVQLLLALILVLVPDSFRQGTAIWWALGVVIPVVIAIYWLVGRQAGYSRHAAQFDAWPARKRAVADVGAFLFGAVSLVAPFAAHSLAGPDLPPAIGAAVVALAI
jgi:hypothetical protein